MASITDISDVAEQGHFAAQVVAQRMLGAAGQDVGLHPQAQQFFTECWVGLVFSSLAAFR